MYAIECEGLTRLYEGHIAALSDVTLSVPRGAAFGLLGENGAGKSTLVRLLMGFIFPTSGLVRVLGEEQVARAHPRIGYVHERPLFEPRSVSLLASAAYPRLCSASAIRNSLSSSRAR